MYKLQVCYPDFFWQSDEVFTLEMAKSMIKAMAACNSAMCKVSKIKPPLLQIVKVEESY